VENVLDKYILLYIYLVLSYLFCLDVMTHRSESVNSQFATSEQDIILEFTRCVILRRHFVIRSFM
jgi:hypothetical protein